MNGPKARWPWLFMGEGRLRETVAIVVVAVAILTLSLPCGAAPSARLSAHLKVTTTGGDSCEGTLTLSDAKSSDGEACVRVAYREIHEQGWRLSSSCASMTSAVGGTSKWSWPLTELRALLESGTSVVLRPAAFRPRPLWTARRLTNSELELGSLALVDATLLYRIPKDGTELPLAASIRITHIGDQEVPAPQRKPLEVGLNEQIVGQYAGPELYYRHLVVQPLVAGVRWVMNSDPPGRFWEGHAQFGRSGLDDFVQFSITAVVSRVRLRPGRVPAQQWDALLRTSIVALSAPVFVVRTDSVYDPARDVAVEISEVGGRRPSSHRLTAVEYGAPIRGYVRGRKLVANETLLVFWRTDENDWALAGRPHLARDGSWEFALIGDDVVEGQLTLLAVVSNKHSDHYERAYTVSESAPVRVVVRREALGIVGVNGQQVIAGDALVVPMPVAGALSIDLSLAAGMEGFFGVFVSCEQAKGVWRFLAPAIRTSSRTATSLPTDSKCRGRMSLVAVQTSEPVEALQEAVSGGRVQNISAATAVEVH